MNAAGFAQLTFQMLTLLKKYLLWWLTGHDPYNINHLDEIINKGSEVNGLENIVNILIELHITF